MILFIQTYTPTKWDHFAHQRVPNEQAHARFISKYAIGNCEVLATENTRVKLSLLYVD